MVRWLGGIVLGAALAAAAGAWWVRMDPCLDRCGSATHCVALHCVPSLATAPVAATAPKDRRRHSHAGGNTATGDPLAPPEVEPLHPGDEKMVAMGDALGRPERIDFSQTEPDKKELGQDDLDHAVHGADSAVFRCITDALGNAPLDGKIEIGLRVEKSGQVSRVRVEAPALLQKKGLTRCVRPVVLGLSFPASGGASVATYPYELK